MQLVTIGSKYQIVIPREIRKKITGLKPGTKLSVNSIDGQTITIRKKDTDWLLKTGGIAKEAWKNIDTTKYLEGLRSEWDRKK